jgi:putative NADH-flavin reductase
MRIVIFGSTGGTGKQLIARGLARGHDVVAVARKPESVAAKHEKLSVVKGDVLDTASVAAAVREAGAVISAIGPSDEKNPGTLISDGIANMVKACTEAKVSRFVFESGLMVGNGEGLGFFGRQAVALFGSLRAPLRDDKRKAEATVRASALDWVIVRPAVLFDGPSTGKYVCAPDGQISAAKKLSFSDVADALLDATENRAFTKATLNAGHA